MTSDRPYRRAPGRGVALAELRRNAGTQFDPAVVAPSAACSTAAASGPPDRLHRSPHADQRIGSHHVCRWNALRDVYGYHAAACESQSSEQAPSAHTSARPSRAEGRRSTSSREARTSPPCSATASRSCPTAATSRRRPPATDDPSEIGPVDVVFLGLKANSYATCGDLLNPLLDDDTAVVAAQNGIPWWYFHGLEGPYAGRQIESVDPGGCVTRSSRPSARSAASSTPAPSSRHRASSATSRAPASRSASRTGRSPTAAASSARR